MTLSYYVKNKSHTIFRHKNFLMHKFPEAQYFDCPKVLLDEQLTILFHVVICD